MNDFSISWSPDINWESPAGIVLKRLVAELPVGEPIRITVFGSAPLQLGLDGNFLSADVDVFSSFDLSAVIARAGLAKGQCAIYIEQSDEIVFSAPPSWRERASVVEVGSVTFLLPHPIDILVSKIKRLEPKDINAFHLVRRMTGHPTPEELKVALQRHIDIFRQNFDEERGGDAVANTRILWNELYGAEIDVRAEIIMPALEIRRKAYGEDAAGLKAEIPGDQA